MEHTEVKKKFILFLKRHKTFNALPFYVMAGAVFLGKELKCCFKKVKCATTKGPYSTQPQSLLIKFWKLTLKFGKINTFVNVCFFI